MRTLGDIVLFLLPACLLACSSTGTGAGIVPVTAIVVPADHVTQARGCGPGAGKVFKYAALVSAVDDSGAAGERGLAHGVYDCFVDASFANLPLGNGIKRYRVELVAFDEAGYAAQRASLDALADPGTPPDLSSFDKLRGNLFDCDATLRVDVTSTAECASRGAR